MEKIRGRSPSHVHVAEAKREDRRCYKCGREGHIAKHCRSSSSICFKCGKAGHTRRDCPAHLGQRARSVGEREIGGQRLVSGDRERRSEDGVVANGRPRSTSSSHEVRGSPGAVVDSLAAPTKMEPPPGTDPLPGYPQPPQNTSQVSSPPQTKGICPQTSGAQLEYSGPGRREGYHRPPRTCFHCGTPGHVKRECPSLSRSNGREKPRDASRGLSHDGEDGAKSQEGEEKALLVPLLDSHCHLEYVFERYSHPGSFQEFVQEHNYTAAFEGCITTFCDPAALSPSLSLWKDLLAESKVWGTFGIHPHNAKYYSPRIEETLLQCLEHPKCVAFGEIGLDYGQHTASDPPTQKLVLERQLSLAVSFDKPLLLHCRDAEDDLLPILVSNVPKHWKIHLHCYTGSVETASRFLTAFPNLYIGVTGNVTFAKVNNVREVVCKVPLGRLLLETDAPYCTPANLPRRLKCRYGHPALVFYVGREVARLRGVGVREVLEAARKNVTALYGI